MHRIPFIITISRRFSTICTEVDGMNACELTAAITAIANWLAGQMSLEQLELLGVSLTQLGDTILTIVTQKGICSK